MAPTSKLLSVLWPLALWGSTYGSAIQPRATTFVGWGKDTVGGTGAASTSTFTVSTYSALKTALKNGGSANSPKIIYVEGTIDAGVLSTGATATEEYYATGTVYNWNLYLQSFNQTYRDELTAAGDTTTLALLDAQEAARVLAAKNQTTQIVLKIPSFTTIIGKTTGSTPAKFQGTAIQVSSVDNVILQNLEVEAPVDFFPEWDPTDGSTGNWNSLYDAISIITSTNVVVDHVAVTDGAHPDDEVNTVFGHVVQRHDGAIDITKGADLVTVQYSSVIHHDKTSLIGSSDSSTVDTGKLRVTFYANYFKDSLQRNPRVRFGKVHVFNNYFEASIAEGLIYFIGLGINSTILSESNVFNVLDATSTAQALNYVTGNYYGYNFYETGSLVNGASADIEASAASQYQTAAAKETAAAKAAGRAVAEWATHDFTDESFEPPYTYTVLAAKNVASYVLANVGPK